jgi:hypothetical protein
MLAVVATVALQAQTVQPLPVETEAKFLKVLLTSAGQFGFACNDATLKAKLEEEGVSVGPGFKYAWGSSEPEVKALKAQDRFIICPSLDWIKAGAALALVEENGKPALYASTANVKASGMTLPDAIAKIAKKI